MNFIFIFNSFESFKTLEIGNLALMINRSRGPVHLLSRVLNPFWLS